jgi:hypothetical protein
MRYILFLICTLTSFLTLQPLRAKENDTPKYYESYWSGTDDELYFVIKLDDNLMLPDSYYPSLANNEVSCKIICTPKEDAPLIEDVPQLKELQLIITVKNCVNPKKVSYSVKTTKLFKEQTEAGGVRTTSSTETSRGFITNPSIDLSAEALFSTTSKDPQKAYIIFKNSFPFSQM